LSLGAFLQKISKITVHRVEFELVKNLVYLELEVGNLRGEEAWDKYKRPPPPLIPHIIFHSLISYAATLLKFY